MKPVRILSFVDGDAVHAYAYNGKFYMTSEVAQELTKGETIVSTEEGTPDFYELSQPFMWRLIIYYWLLCRNRNVKINFLEAYLSLGHGDDLVKMVLEQLDILNRQFYELSEIPSDQELKDLKRRFLGWFYTNLVYSSPDSDGKQNSTGN